MEPAPIDIDKIETLDDFYQYLDVNALLFGNEHIITPVGADLQSVPVQTF